MATHKPTRRLVISGLILATIVPVLTFGQLPGDSLLWRELQNTGHTLLFLIVSPAALLLLRELLPVTTDRPLLAYLSAGIASLAVGVMIELLQLSVHREPSVFDVLRDFSGIVCGLGIYAVFDTQTEAFWLRQRPAYRGVTLLFACCLCVASLFPLLRLAIAYAQRDAAFPVITDISASWSERFLRFEHSKLSRVKAPGHRAASVQLGIARYPGVSMVEPYPDWSAFEHLLLVIHSEHPHPFSLVLRVHDYHHNQSYADRFNQRLWIEKGENRFRIPLMNVRNAPAEREMDMSRIAGLTLFATDLASPVSFQLDALRLE